MMDSLILIVVAMLFGAVGVFYLIGPAARTAGIAHLVGKPVVFAPRSDRTMGLHRVSSIDAMGCYYVKRKRKTLVYRVDPRHVFILGKKIPSTTVLEGFAMNVSPEYAKLAEARERGEKAPKIEVNGESVDWNALGRQVKEWLGPGHLASIMASAYQANKPVESVKSARVTTLRLMGLGVVVVVIVVGIYLARMMGWI